MNSQSLAPDNFVRKYVRFSVGGIDLAIPVNEVREITLPLACAKTARVSSGVLGFANCRQSVVPLVDLRMYFELVSPNSAKHCIIISSVDEQSIGINVDLVHGVFEPSAEQKRNVPRMKSVSLTNIVLHAYVVEQHLSLVLDTQRLCTQVLGAIALEGELSE